MMMWCHFSGTFHLILLQTVTILNVQEALRMRELGEKPNKGVLKHERAAKSQRYPNHACAGVGSDDGS